MTKSRRLNAENKPLSSQQLAVKPLIFDLLPELSQHLDWLSLNLVNAPVQKVNDFDHEHFWIKRNDLINDDYAGNKLARLEFILADVLKQKKSHVITFGGTGSNFCLAVAIFCQKLGLKCTLCLFEQPVTEQVQQHIKLFHHFGANIDYIPGILKSSINFYLRHRFSERNAYFIAPGGATILGTIGAINSALHLKQQIDNGDLPEPDYVICPTASNCGMAGLILGFLLTDLKTEVIGVRTGRDYLGPIALNTPDTVKRTVIKTYRYLQDKANLTKKIDIVQPTIINDFFGSGYGYPTEQGQSASNIFKQKLNIELEATYTAKTGAALLALLKKQQYTHKNLLYWHTYHHKDYKALTDTINIADLPSNCIDILNELNPIK